MTSTELTGITRGKIKKPIFALLYGPDGTGKTTFGSEAPAPIFLGPEQGSENLDVARFNDVHTYLDVVNKVKDLRTKKHSYETLVLDSLDWTEPLLHAQICAQDGSTTIESACGGYGKGFTFANSMWANLIADVKALRTERNMNIIVLAHSQVKTFNDPSQTLPYDRYMLKLNEKAGALWREAVDAVLFVNFETLLRKEKGDRKAKAFGEDKRILYTQRRPSFDAKNRYGLPPQLPFELGFAWSVFKDAVDKGQPESEAVVREDLADLVSRAQPEMKERIQTAINAAGSDLSKLVHIRNHARIVVGE